MTVTVQRRGSVSWSLDKALDLAVATAVSMIVRRTQKGLDVTGVPFKSYSASYAEALREGGESTAVDLTVTGAYLASIGERSRSVDHANMRATATIGPGTGTSEQRHFADGRAKHTGRRSPPHNVLARYLSVLRPHLGLTPDECKRLAAAMAKVLVRQGR